jgi:CubicO group peptidase (beta-lactamase class C family)
MARPSAIRTAIAAAVVLLGTTVSGGTAAVAAPAAPSDGVAAVIVNYQSRIPELMDQEDITGLALVLVDGDQVLWQQGFGSTDNDGGTPVTVDTMFSVQSMSKTFTATAVMVAVQSGLLDLDVPITTYLPDFTVHSAFESHPERKITLRMLLGHTAGFTHDAPLGNTYEPGPGEFDAHAQSISETWLRFPVGTGYAYSNLGIDLAGYILQQVSGDPFPVVMRGSLLAPLGMDHSTFDRRRVHATGDRAMGHTGDLVRPRVDCPMMAAGGLWTTASDLAKFLEFQLGDGTIDGRTVLDEALVQEMRTVPSPRAGAPAGYALGVVRLHWPAGRHPDLFNHNGGGDGFLADLWWLPQLQLGIAVLTNSDTHGLQESLALGILNDLITAPDSPYPDRMLGLPAQPDVVVPDSHFVPPPDLAARIAAVAMPPSSEQSARWAGYHELYRTGQMGAMNPADPPSRFYVESGVPYFDAAEEGTPVTYRLTEFQPGLFLANNGETLDLRAPSQRWRGVNLNPVTGGPLAWQWALLAVVSVVGVGWLAAGSAAWLRRRRAADRSSTVDVPSPGGRTGRRLTAAIAIVGSLAALTTAAAILAMPGLADVGFLGSMETPIPVRLAFHLPLAVTLLTLGLAVLLLAGALRRWRTPRVRARDAALAVALTALSAQLALWHLVGWGF